MIENIFGPVLQQMLRTKEVTTLAGRRVSLTGTAPAASLLKLQQLVAETRPETSLEVGFAKGGSALAILYALSRNGRGRHTVIDPNQKGSGIGCYEGIGLSMVERAGLSALLELIELPSHAALPKLLADQRRFDFILIDGWRSFDNLLVDFFYADLMLNERGVLVINDRSMPQVHQVLRFIETHKPYERLGRGSGAPLNPWRLLTRRLRGPSAAEAEWGTMQAYRKLRDHTVHWSFYTSEFYPYFRFYRWWMKLRGLKPAHLIETPPLEYLD